MIPLSQLVEIPAEADRLISALSLDSRTVKPGTLFFACRGTQVHGSQYIPVALRAGAVAVLLEDDRSGVDWQEGVPIVRVPQLSRECSAIAGRFFGQPSHHLPVAAITGTNGKTSISYFIAQQLPCGIIGTVGYGFAGQLRDFGQTTPDPIITQQFLAELHAQGAQFAAMETSSHGLSQYRIEGVRFSTAVFTNLSRDHLDYHGTLEAYAAAKKRLFQWPDLQHAVINIDDPIGREICTETRAKLWRYSVQNPAAELYCRHITATDAGYALAIASPLGDITVDLPLWGHFNIANALATLGVLLSWAIPLEQAAASLSQLRPVAGRMERFSAIDKPSVIVDYAHTPDALSQTLQAIRPHCRGRLWCVFGCGGNRDPGKRPLMGQAVAREADMSVITDDNPRHEASADIIAAIVPGLGDAPYQVIPDRAEAIAFAIHHASADDVVLVAGKGHENYQQIGTQRLPFSDREIVETLLTPKGVFNRRA